MKECTTRLLAVGNEKTLTLPLVTPELQALFQAHCKELQEHKVGREVRRVVAFGRYMHIHLNRDHTTIAFTLIYEPCYEKCQGDRLQSFWAAGLQIILQCGLNFEQTAGGEAFAEMEGDIAITITHNSCSIHSDSTNCLIPTEALSPSDLLTMCMAPHSTCGSGTIA